MVELHPKSWTHPLQLTRCSFFYEQIYITLQIPSRTPLPAHTQPTAYRRSLRHLPNPPATMDTRLSGRRYRRTRTSTIQNYDRPPQKPLHRRQTRPRKNTGRAYRRVVLYARKGRLPKGVKSPQPKADRKEQSQTVQTLRAQHPLKYLLHIANLPKSSFYYHQDRPDPDAADKALLVETYRRHKGRYGQRRIAAALDWNRKKAARLMRQLGLKAKIRAKKAYRHPAMGEISEHLLKRRFKARKPNEKWLTDVTELKGKDGKLYLSPILDLFNREIVAYAMSRRADSEMVKEMLEKAAPRLTAKGTMLHSDQGVLYRTAGYRELLAEHSMVQSMSRKANCWDNAPMESFFAVLKTECFYNAGELTVDELMKQIDDYMDYYNRERCSLKLKKLSPVAYRTQLTQSA